MPDRYRTGDRTSGTPDHAPVPACRKANRCRPGGALDHQHGPVARVVRTRSGDGGREAKPRKDCGVVMTFVNPFGPGVGDGPLVVPLP